MQTEHYYSIALNWTGDKGSGTSSYKAYSRSHSIKASGKPIIVGSSDPAFSGEADKYNPEELLIASLSSCHMLWYLHFCAEAGIVVTAYTDNAKGLMIEQQNGGGHFDKVTLYPMVTIKDATKAKEAEALHQKANKYCFIANSVNFKVYHDCTIIIG